MNQAPLSTALAGLLLLCIDPEMTALTAHAVELSPPAKSDAGKALPSDRRYDEGPLSPEDFAAEPSGPANVAAYTYTGIQYNYRYRALASQEGVRAAATSISAHATVLRDKSWNRTPGSTRLLDHEQGHFDITHLHAIEWKRHVESLIERGTLIGRGTSEAAARESLEAAVRHEFQNFLKRLQAEQSRYDNETNHGMNPARQAEWRKQLDAELGKHRT